MDCPYLEAIQGIPGSTPGEKYRALNAAAATVISIKSKNPDINLLDAIKSLNIPDPLIPLVHAEVSKNLRNSSGVIEALKSEDDIVFERALKAKWFFDGSYPDITNAQYYEDNIFSHVSVSHRLIIIKKLAVYLSPHNDKSPIAEEFYIQLVRNYGKQMGEPLLVACSENFIKKLIIDERKIGLNARLVKMIYRKYPNVIIDCLKMEEHDDPRERNFPKVNIFHYSQILPLLVKKNTHSFIEIIEKYKGLFMALGLRFSRKRTEALMKHGVDAVIRNPQIFLELTTLKVTEKLSKDQFRLMFRNVFPKERKDFHFTTTFKYLEFCQEEKMELLLSTFEEVYGVKLLDCQDQVEPEVLRALPQEERVNQARKKLEKDQEWHLGCSWKMERSWRCYLSTEEAIPMIKQQISKSSVINDRRDLLQQMILTCSINGDELALLGVLNYIIARHKNEQGWMLLEVLGQLLDKFPAQNLSAKHWEIIDDIIQLLHVKNELHARSGQVQQIIIAGIHFSLINHLPIEERIDLLIQVYSKAWNRNWNILTDHPDYERICLVTFLEIIGKKYPADHEFWKESWSDVAMNLIQAIYNFNETNSKNTKSKLENLTLKSYSWLLESVKKILNNQDVAKWTKVRLLDILKKGEREIWEALVPAEPTGPAINCETIEILIRLKKNPTAILANWEAYLSAVEDNTYKRLTQRFLKSCRWYQELPIKFAEKSLSKLKVSKSSTSLIVLALLYDGSSFGKMIRPLAPKTPELNTKAENAASEYQLVFTIPRSLNVVIPPVSLDIVLEYCIGDYIHEMANCWTNLGRRVSVAKVVPFALKLMDRGVSIKKHAIRMFIRTSTISEIRVVLTNLLRNEKHRSIRAIVFDKIVQLFRAEPGQDTWAIMREAIEDLRPDDDAFTTMTSISPVADEFVVDYVKLLLVVIRRLERVEGGLSRKQALARFNQVINSTIAITYIFPEEFHEFILNEYFADLSQPDYALSTAMRDYVVRGYLQKAGEKLKLRLEFITGLVNEIIKKYWDVGGEEVGLLLGNHVVYQLTQEVVRQRLSTPIMKAIVQALFKSFFSILKASHEPTSYLYLTYASLFEATLTSKDFARKIGDILPSVIEELGRESLTLVGKVLRQFFNVRCSCDQWKYSALEFIEGLLDVATEESTILAAMMLGESSGIRRDIRVWGIVRQLQKHQHPAVIANVYDWVNQLEKEE